RLRIVCCFALTASQGACMPKPPNNPKGTPTHRPCGVHCATRKIRVAAELAQNCSQFWTQTVPAPIHIFSPLLVVAKEAKSGAIFGNKALNFKSQISRILRGAELPFEGAEKRSEMAG